MHDEPSAVNSLFRRWVYTRHQQGDRRRATELAADLLGDRAAADRRRLARSLPLWLRIGADSPLRVAAFSALVVAPLVLARVLLTRTPEIPPDARLVAVSLGPDGGGTWRADLRRDRWDPAELIQLQKSGPPLSDVLTEGRITGPISSGPDGRSWIVGHVFPDSGGWDLVQVFADGRPPRRLTAAPGDDAAATWAPDGSAVAFTTGRWDPQNHADVAVLDIETGSIRPLSRSEGSDSYPRWSPDGSRIGFGRRFLSGGRSQICVAAFDGEESRCHDLELQAAPVPLGWLDDRNLAFEQDSAGIVVRKVLDCESDALVPMPVPHGGRVSLSPDGAWALWSGRLPGVPEARHYVLPIDRPNALRGIQGAFPEDAQLVWEWGGAAPRFLARLEVIPPTGAVPLLARYQLRVRGASADGRPVVVPQVRWRSGDSTAAHVTPSGLVRPYRDGRVTVFASAGGWRSDTLSIEIASVHHEIVLEEAWEHGLDDGAWVPWGEPLPAIDSALGAPRRLLTRGDSSFDSGVYTRRAFDPAGGLGFEAVLSGRIETEQWQRHGLGLFAEPDSAGLSTWDHRTGGLTISGAGPPAVCLFAYPAREGWRGSESASYGCGGEVLTVPIKRALGDGIPHNVRLQLLPDGRLGLAIDGAPLGIGAVSVPLDRPYRILISGQSHGTKLMVGAVTTWTGVRGDIDWRQVPCGGGTTTPMDGSCLD
jgi:hypothetical protein